MSWGKKKIAGVEYDLTHLDDFVMDVTPKTEGAQTYKVHVSFGCHTFTKAWDSGYGPDLKFVSDGEERCFCPIRHGHSAHLPGLVQSAVNGKAHFSRIGNYLLVKNLPGMNGPYAIFFDIKRATKSDSYDVMMSVITAYQKPDLPKRLPAITFATLVEKTSRGERIKQPKK